MAEIIGQSGINLTEELANYLNNSQGNINSQELASIVDQYL